VRQKRHHGWPFRLAEDVPPGRLSGHRVRIASWSDFEAIVFLGCPQRMYAVLGEHQPLLQQADQVGQFNGPAVRGLGGRQFALGDPAADGAVGRPPRSVTAPTDRLDMASRLPGHGRDRSVRGRYDPGTKRSAAPEGTAPYSVSFRLGLRVGPRRTRSRSAPLLSNWSGAQCRAARARVREDPL
jgi:hypothetical protein